MSSIPNSTFNPDTDQARRNGTGTGMNGLLRRTISSAVAAALVLLVLSCVGCQSPQKLPGQLQCAETGALAPGDVLKFTFPGSPELNQAQKIQADGKVSLPMLGVVS